jgi:ElaB/YqjD/DUF883 family membrane-anchored ribosome-binding protein
MDRTRIGLKRASPTGDIGESGRQKGTGWLSLERKIGSLDYPGFPLVITSCQEDIMTTADTTATKEKLAQDLKIVIADAEELLRATASQAGEKVSAARDRIQDSLRHAKVKLAEVEDAFIDQGKQAARAADEYVHEHPWKAVGIAAGIGLVVGMLISRR